MKQVYCTPTKPRKPTHLSTGIRPPSPYDRQAIKIASISGLEDKDIAAQHPGLTTFTIRKWRSRDPVWQTAYHATRRGYATGRKPQAVKDAEARTHPTLKPASLAVTSATLAQGIPEIASRNRLRIANEVDRALAKRAKNKQPLPIDSLADLNQAGRALVYAEGRDAEAPAIQLNVWGTPGLQAQQPTNGFRDLPAETAPLDGP